jgi:hypothetical protein
MAASARFKCYMINPAQTTTPPLSNINSIDLSPTEWKFTPLPSSVLTDASLEAHKLGMAQISRKTFDALVTGNSAFSYGIIMQLDREYRELLAAMPDAFLQEFKALEEKDPIIRGKRYIALQGVHVSLSSFSSSISTFADPFFVAEPHRPPSPSLPRQRVDESEVRLQYRRLYQVRQDCPRLSPYVVPFSPRLFFLTLPLFQTTTSTSTATSA